MGTSFCIWTLGKFHRDQTLVGDSSSNGGGWIRECPPKKNRVRNYTWRIIPISKWLIIMVSKSPNWRCSTSKWPRWLIIGGDPNHLRSSWDPILQVVICLDELVWKQLSQKFTAEEIGKNECQTTLWLGERSTTPFPPWLCRRTRAFRKARPHEKCRFLSSWDIRYKVGPEPSSTK